MSGFPYPVWLHFDDGVESVWGWPGQFSVRMFPEQIEAIEKAWGRTLVRICTDTEDNQIWVRPPARPKLKECTCDQAVASAVMGGYVAHALGCPCRDVVDNGGMKITTRKHPGANESEATATIQYDSSMTTRHGLTLATGVDSVEIREAFIGPKFITSDGEELSVCMRDSGFEIHYQSPGSRPKLITCNVGIVDVRETGRSVAQVIGEALGAASVCWDNPGGAGVFHSDRAQRIVEETIAALGLDRDDIVASDRPSTWVRSEVLVGDPRDPRPTMWPEFTGVVVDTGGGQVKIGVDRDTEQYPSDGDRVTVRIAPDVWEAMVVERPESVIPNPSHYAADQQAGTATVEYDEAGGVTLRSDEPSDPLSQDRLLDLLESAWGVIANAGLHKGSWDHEHPEWVQAAERWRDSWHAVLEARYPARARVQRPMIFSDDTDRVFKALRDGD